MKIMFSMELMKKIAKTSTFCLNKSVIRDIM